MFKNLEELKNNIINYLKSIIKNENNKKAIELINKNGYLAAESQGQIKVYTDKEKSKKGGLHLAYCEILGADGKQNNKYAKQFIKENTIQSLLNEAFKDLENDKLKLENTEKEKYLLIDLQNKINDYFNSLSIEIENVNVRFSDYNIEYYLNFNNPIGEEYFNIYFKIQDNKYIYDDKYKEEKYIFDKVDEVLKHFKKEITPSIEKKISFLKMYSTIEKNFKNNIDKKILFKSKDTFYTATIDNQYITLYEVNRKKEKAVYNYLYLKQFIDLFIKDNINRFIIIDGNTDLSVKNLRNLINSNNNCIMIHEEIKADTEQEKEEKTKESKNIDILIKDIKESIKNDTYQITLQGGHICLLHSNTAYSTNFNLLEYNVNTELTEEQREYIEKETDFYIHSYNFDNIDILKNEILKKYNISSEKENYKTLNIKTSNDLIKIIYNYDVEGKSIFTIISKNKKREIYKQENKSKKCILSILNILINESIEEVKNNDLGVEKMNTKKELRPIYNEDIKGHKEYIFEQLEKYKSGDLNFTHKRINNKMIEEYTKYFLYKDNTFMAVKPSENGYPSGYYEHVKQYNYKIDHINKIILFTDTEVEEVQDEETKKEIKGIEEIKNKTVKQSKVNGALKRYNLGIKRSLDFYNSIDEQIEKYKNNNSHLYNYYIDKKEEYKKDLEKSKEAKENFINNILPNYTIIEDVEPIKEEFYNNNEVEEGKEMQSKEIKELEKKYNVDIKFREFRGKLMYSVFYSPLKNNVTGIFKDIKQLEKQCKSIIIDNRINLTNKINKLENEYLRNI